MLSADEEVVLLREQVATLTAERDAWEVACHNATIEKHEVLARATPAEGEAVCNGCGTPKVRAVLAIISGKAACCPDCWLGVNDRNAIREALSKAGAKRFAPAPVELRAPVPSGVTAAMVEAFAEAWDGQKMLEKHNHERIRASLIAALGGQA